MECCSVNLGIIRAEALFADATLKWLSVAPLRVGLARFAGLVIFGSAARTVES